MMPMMPIHPEFQRVFDEHAAPTYAKHTDVFAQLVPIARITADVRKQVIEYQALVTTAELTGASELRGSLEHLHQTFRVVESRATAAEASLRDLSQSLAQLDRYLAEAKSHLGAAVPAEPPTGAPNATS